MTSASSDIKLVDKHKKSVRLWMVSSSDKWIRGVESEIQTLGETYSRRISIGRLSPLEVGERRFQF